MARNPDFARQQSAKQYARIKADPDLYAAHKLRARYYYSLPNYRDSLIKGWKKYREANKEERRVQRQVYIQASGSKWLEMSAEIEAKRTQKRSEQLAWMKENNPAAYADLLITRRHQARERKRETRLNELNAQFNEILKNEHSDSTE